MELRPRSRSKTPYQTEHFINAESYSEKISGVNMTRTSRRLAMAKISVTSHQHVSSKPEKHKNMKSFASMLKTSDYSSEEGEIETTSPRITDNDRNQIMEDASIAANGNSEISALSLYRNSDRYWDKYPKTDYTYSRHSRDRVEIAPGVVQMPNMSRRTIHLDCSTNTDDYYTRSVKQKLFSSSNNNEEISDSYQILRLSNQRKTFYSRIVSFFVIFYTTIYWCLNGIYKTSNQITIYFAKKLHHLASRIMLLDTWILKKNNGSDNKLKLLLALSLMPLLLFAAWYFLSCLGAALYGTIFNSTNTTISQTLTEQMLNSDILRNEDSLEGSLSHQLNTDEIVEKILKHPTFHNVYNNYYNNLNIAQESESNLREIINELKTEMSKIQMNLEKLEANKNDEIHKMLSDIRAENIQRLSHLSQKIYRCCNQNMIDLEPYIGKVFGTLLNDPKFLQNQQGLTDYLHNLFVAKQYLETSLNNITTTLNISTRSTIDEVMETLVLRLSEHPLDSQSVTEEQIKKVVQSILKIYDADKTGLVDYALETAGGQIVTTKCTEKYDANTAVITIMGYSVWSPVISPRIVITPGVHPGECWAFQNFPGFLVIKLTALVKIEAFSIEHVSRLLVPDGRIDSAPKEFEVFGMDDENEKHPIKIGEYVYDYNGEPLQFFIAQKTERSFPMVELKINSNYGNLNYTCLYRFRVHGRVDVK